MNNKNGLKYAIGIVVLAIVGTTGYFIGKNESKRNYTKMAIELNKTKSKLEELTDSLKSIKERKEDYQTGFRILSKYLDRNVNVREKITEAYSNKKINDGEAARWMLGNVPGYNPKPQQKKK
ncbi:MAG: hypothetical protein ACPLXC_00540 [Candidatus Pacearchaeota archaeon]